MKKPKTITKLTPIEVIVLSALFARTNMGQSAPTKEAIRRLSDGLERTSLSLEGAVINLCGDCMETDEHQRIFEGEAKSWMKTFKKVSREEVISTWPYNAELVWEPPMWDTSSIYAMERTARNQEDGLCATRIRGHWLEVETRDGKKFTYKFGLNKVDRSEATKILASKKVKS